MHQHTRLLAMKHIAIILLALTAATGGISACTSAIISGRVTGNHRPLLWKHRDTSRQDNKVERIAATDSTFEYVALYNAGDTLCREAWIGYNSQGFAVMNTAVYNLKADTVALIDQEGFVMTEALKRCRTVDDFEQLLNDLPKPLGVEANFGTIDALGNGAYFETGNYGYTKYDLADAPDGVLVRTNYAHSGRKGEGKGYTRETNAWHQLAPHIDSCNVSAQLLTETLSRRFYSSKRNCDISLSGDKLVADQEFIPRYTSTATVVIEGVTAGENPLLTTMWVGLGYPPCSEIHAVWLDGNGVPASLRGTGNNHHSPQCDTVVARKREVFGKDGNGNRYADLSKLYNNAGTGYCQKLAKRNSEAYEQGYRRISEKRKHYHGNSTL